MKHNLILPVLLCAVLGAVLPSPAPAAVPLRWQVETSRLQPVAFDAVRGETLALEAAFNSYGTPLSMAGKDVALFYQTNGMGSAWWTAPATAVSNRITSTFTPQMVPGRSSGQPATAPVAIQGFLGSTGDIYRAAFTVRFRNGPGATPNVIDGPVPILDLAHTVVVNPPWPTKADFAATTTVMRAELKGYIDGQIEGAGVVSPSTVTNITTNVVTKSYVENLGISAGLTSNDVQSISSACCSGLAVSSSNYTAACCSGLAVSLTNLVASATNSVPQITDGYNTIRADGTVIRKTSNWVYNDFYYEGYVPDDVGPTLLSSGEEWEWCLSNGSYFCKQLAFGDKNSVFLSFDHGELAFTFCATNIVSTSITKVATTNDLPTTAAQVNAYPAASGNQLATQVATIGAYLNAEDARFVSTNYNSATHLPEAYVQVKLPDQSWSTVWREMTRWNWLTNSYLPTNYSTRAELDQKADRAWGYYDSHTGSYAPDGFTWISSPRIAIAADLAYQRTVTSEGAIWVLESSGVVTQTGGSTNGYFRISDDEQNTLFEIVKGRKRTIGADASRRQVVSGYTPTKLQIGYSIQADSHPTIEVCTNLTDNTWKAETEADCAANVSWSGSSGAYVAQVQGKANYPALFVKATYEAGGESYVRNVAAVSMTHLYIGGAKYAVGTATISGHTVLTLTPAN